MCSPITCLCRTITGFCIINAVSKAYCVLNWWSLGKLIQIIMNRTRQCSFESAQASCGHYIRKSVPEGYTSVWETSLADIWDMLHGFWCDWSCSWWKLIFIFQLACNYLNTFNCHVSDQPSYPKINPIREQGQARCMQVQVQLATRSLSLLRSVGDQTHWYPSDHLD